MDKKEPVSFLQATMEVAGKSFGKDNQEGPGARMTYLPSILSLARSWTQVWRYQ